MRPGEPHLVHEQVDGLDEPHGAGSLPHSPAPSPSPSFAACSMRWSGGHAVDAETAAGAVPVEGREVTPRPEVRAAFDAGFGHAHDRPSQ